MISPPPLPARWIDLAKEVQECGGVDGDLDGDGWTEANGDCDDSDPNINPSVPEDCSDGVDNNCDGQTDVGCLDPCAMAAATSSYLGCEFYASDLPQYSLNKDYAIVVSNPSNTQTANVTISTLSGVVDTAAIGPNTLHIYSVPSTSRTQNIASAGVHDKAYRIQSDLPVAAYQFNSLTTVGWSMATEGRQAATQARKTSRTVILPGWISRSSTRWSSLQSSLQPLSLRS